MTILKACCDESCTHGGAPVSYMGGYLFDGDGEQAFTTKWTEIMRPFVGRGLKYFHATDCYPKPGRTDNKFAKNLSDEEKNGLFHSIISLVRDTAKLGVISALEGHVFDEVINRNKFQSFTGTKYTVCALRSLTLIEHWADKNQFQGKFFYAFESGNQYEHEANEMMNRIREIPKLRRDFRYENHGFFPKTSLPPLQAADMLVWLYQRTRSQPPEQAHVFLKELLEAGSLKHLYMPITDLSLNVLALQNMYHEIKSKRRYEAQTGAVKKYIF